MSTHTDDDAHSGTYFGVGVEVLTAGGTYKGRWYLQGMVIYAR